MKRRIAAVVSAALLSACATTPNDYDLQWSNRSATLYVYSPAGSQLPLLGDMLLELHDYHFSGSAIRIHPGEQVIGYSCARKDGVVINDYLPQLRFTFEAGRSYELRCIEGSPTISALPASIR